MRLLLLFALSGVTHYSFAQGFLIDTIPSEKQADSPDRVVNIMPYVAGEEPVKDPEASNAWQEIASHGDWAVQCQAEIAGSKTAARCRMLSLAISGSQKPQGKGRSAEFTIESIAPKGAPQSIGIINMPGEMLLPVGISARVDQGSQIKLAVRSCHFDQSLLQIANPIRCLAPFRLTDGLLNSFKAGQNIKLEWQDLSGKPQVQMISLSGFTAAYADFTKQK